MKSIMRKNLFFLLVLICLGVSVRAQITVTGDITANTTWTSNNIYQLTGGFIYVTNNATLTIEPGTLIKGNASSLVITRGARIIASGTPSRPIVFTSFQPAGSRAAGDWGGVLILGRAPINDPAGFRLAEGGIDPSKGLYGGTDVNDNSGVFQYVRIEFAGIAFQPNNETNGLTCGAVGLGTTIDHVQVSFGGDDSFEWFGGTVNAKYLVAYRGLDDEFDTDYGWSGRLQFCVSLRDSSIADVSGSNGFESDNDATGSTNAPLTNAVISNLTIVGPRRTSSTTVNTNYRRAAHLRRSTSQSVYNTILVGYPTGIKVENQTTWNNAASNSLQWKNNIIAGCPQPFDTAGLTTGPTTFFLPWYNANSNTTLTNVSDVMLTNPYNFTNPNFRPMPGSPALTGASFTSPKLSNPFFTPTTYRGAFDGTNDWTACWTNWNPQNTPYTTPGIDNLPLAVNAAGPTTFCQGGSVTLTATASGATYLWSNGATTSSISATTSGSYTVTATSGGCTAISTPIAVTVNPAPSLSVTPSGSTTFCQGGSVTLTANASGATYLWSNGSTTSSISATTSGSYTVTATSGGCSTISTPITVTVNPAPSVSVTPSGSTTFCQGGSVTLTANSSGSTFQWSNGSTTSSITATTSGSYTVTATNSGCTGISTPITVTVNPAPSVSVNPSGLTTFCQGGNVILTSSSANGYSWSNSSTSQSILVNSTGSYIVTVTDANGCTNASTPVSVTVNPLPTAIATANGNTSFCTGDSVVICASGGTSYLWNNASTSNCIVVFASGAFSVQATDANGCTSTASNNVNVNVSATPPPSVNVVGDSLLCDGETVDICSSQADSYLWSNGDTTQCITVGSAGTYNVIVTNANQCDGVGLSADVTITVNPTPVAGYTFSGNFPAISFTSTSMGATTWAWDFGDGNSSSQANPAHVYQSTGNYQVCLVAGNAFGCTDSLCQSVDVLVSVTNPDMFMGAMLRPNPAKDAVTLVYELSSSSAVEVVLLNYAGQVINKIENQYDSGVQEMILDVAQLPAGFYFVRINTEMSSKTLKLTVAR